MESRIEVYNGLPTIAVDGKRIATDAYVTYFTENAEYEDFTKAGYDLYSVCASFTKLNFNEETNFTNHRTGIFDDKNNDDFREFDSDISDLIAVNPKAMIFPRIYISMPLWWLKEHPNETVFSGITPEGREMMCSDAFRHDGAEMLRIFIDHINGSSYKDNIIGYQIAGGTTQEWFHFDKNGSFCENAFPYFVRYMKEKHPETEINKESFLHGDYYEYYVDFSNESMTETVEYFAKTVKDHTDGKQIVGAFYGYCVEVHAPLGGSHNLEGLIDSPYIDFYCSPVSCCGARQLGEDWVSMLPEDSLKIRGKLYVAEADIRTHLTRFPDEYRSDLNLKKPYRGSIWLGGPTEDLSVKQIRKPFARLLTHSAALWWFDMWGGWYHSDGIMKELTMQKAIADSMNGCDLPYGDRAAVFIDEKMYKHYPNDHRQQELCRRLSVSGIVYDMYLLCDLPRLKDKYHLIFLPSPEHTRVTDSLDLSNTFCVYDSDISVEDIRRTAKETGVHLFAEDGDVISCGNGYLEIHSVKDGPRIITLPRDYSCTCLTGQKMTAEGNRITIDLEKWETAIIRIS